MADRIDLLSPPATPVPPLGLRERRRERRRLAEEDRRAAHRAELYLLGGLLNDAGRLVTTGWVQHCWFTVRDAWGRHRPIGPANLEELDGATLTGTCLVGAIVQAGGGVPAAGTQPVRRAIDLTWATLYNAPVRWCPSPSVRLAHVHDLTRWNDMPRRSSEDVATLLDAAALRALP